MRRAIVAVLAALLLSCTGCGLLSHGAYGLPLPGGPDAGRDPDSLTLQFASVEGLVPKSSVRLDNVTVGEVEDISVDQSTWTAEVTCKIRHDLKLPANVQARVRSSSLLGEWYVELDRPDAPSTQPLQSGATVPLTATSGSAPVEEVLGALSMLLNDGGLPQLHTIVSELDQAMDGNEPQVRALLGDLTRLTGSLDANRDDIVRALDGLDALSGTLKDNKQQIADALDVLPQGLETLADQRPALVRMLRSLDRLSDVTVRVVNASRDDTVADLKSLRPILTQLQAAGTDLPDALKILLTFPFTPGAMGAIRGDYVNLDGKLDLDLADVLQVFTRTNQPIELGGQLLSDPLAILGDVTPGSPSPNSGPSRPAQQPGEHRTHPRHPNTASSDGGLGGLLGLLLGGGS